MTVPNSLVVKVLSPEQSASLSEPLAASFCHGDSSTSFGATTLVSSAA